MHAIWNSVKQHKILSGISLIVILFIIFLNIFLQNSHQNKTYTVTRENLVNTVLVNGTYSIAAQTQVISPSNGVVTKLYVSNDDVVKKGDQLFHVESSATPDQQKAAYANYLSASSQLQADTAMLYTLQSTMYAAWQQYTNLATNSTYQNSDGSPNIPNRTLPQFTTLQDDWLAAEANYKNQQAVIVKDQASLSSALQQYNETQSVTVTAPIAGKVINLSAQLNDQVTASTPTVTAPAVLVIADFSNPVITAAVDQVNIPRLAIGQQASLVFDALPDKTFYGKITTIDTAGTPTQGTTNFNVYITANDLPISIKPNMTVSATIETARKNNVLTIPNDAIITKNGKTYVQLANNSLVPITIGLQGITKTEVTQGLSAGDTIIEQQ